MCIFYLIFLFHILSFLQINFELNINFFHQPLNSPLETQKNMRPLDKFSIVLACYFTYLDNCAMYKWASLKSLLLKSILTSLCTAIQPNLLSFCQITHFPRLLNNKRWVTNMCNYLLLRQTERFQKETNGPPKFVSY